MWRGGSQVTQARSGYHLGKTDSHAVAPRRPLALTKEGSTGVLLFFQPHGQTSNGFSAAYLCPHTCARQPPPSKPPGCTATRVCVRACVRFTVKASVPAASCLTKAAFRSHLAALPRTPHPHTPPHTPPSDYLNPTPLLPISASSTAEATPTFCTRRTHCK